MAAGTRYFTESFGYVNQEHVWEWDGEQWHQIPDSALPERVSSGAMAYDSERQKTVFFGGIVEGGAIQRTFEWDGVSWSEHLGASRPEARSGHAMVYDEHRGVCVLFGGTHNQPLGDTWEYDGNSWREVSRTGPSPRFGAAMVYDPVRQRVVLHGGSNSEFASAFSDVWEWDGEGWTRVQTSNRGPAVLEHSMAIDSRSGDIIVTHGKRSRYVIEFSDKVWSFKAGSWTLLPAAPFLPRAGHTTLFHSGLNKVLLFGGEGRDRRYSDLWVYDGAGWTPDDVAPPTHRSGSLAYDVSRGNFVYFGGALSGSGEEMVLSNQTWIYDKVWRRVFPKNSPTARIAASFVFDENTNELVLIGGQTGNPTGRSFDMWAWNGEDWRRIPIAGRTPWQTRLVWFDRVKRKIVLISAEVFNPTPLVWVWHGQSWQQTTTEAPRAISDVVYDRSRNLALLREALFRQTWLFDGKSFRLAFTETGDFIYGPVLAFDHTAGYALKYGGSFEYSGSTNWGKTWDGASWTDVGVQPPGGRSAAAYASSSDGRTLIFGGRGYAYGGIDFEYYDDTWSVEWRN